MSFKKLFEEKLEPWITSPSDQRKQVIRMFLTVLAAVAALMAPIVGVSILITWISTTPYPWINAVWIGIPVIMIIIWAVRPDKVKS